MLSSETKHRHKRRIGGKSFVILPIVFCVGVWTLLFVSFLPILSPFVTVVSVVFTSSEKDFSTQYNDLFVPVMEDKTSNTVGTEEEGETSNTVGTEKEGETSKTVGIEEFVFPSYGDRFGELIIPDCGIDCPLFMGDGAVALRNGAGIYYGSRIPGYGGTTLVAGHNNTVFNGLKSAAEGQEIIIRTSYGNFKYTIKKTAVKDAQDATAYDLAADYENLILYTCYPFDEIGLTRDRFFVYAELTDGVTIRKNAE